MDALHLPTLALALMAGFALLVVQYTVSGQRWLPQGELRRWALLCLLLLGATALLTLQAAVPAEWVAATGSLALGSGLLALVLALLRFLRQPLQTRHLALAFGAYCVVVVVSALWAPTEWRIAAVTFSAAAFLLPLTWSVSRHGWRRRAFRCVRWRWRCGCWRRCCCCAARTRCSNPPPSCAPRPPAGHRCASRCRSRWACWHCWRWPSGTCWRHRSAPTNASSAWPRATP